MMCPYNIMTIEQVNQDRYDYSDEGYNTFHEHKMIENRVFTECLKENCGAWDGARCCYRGAVD